MFFSLATIENFNVVETLSDNATIVYQTHKVNTSTAKVYGEWEAQLLFVTVQLHKQENWPHALL